MPSPRRPRVTGSPSPVCASESSSRLRAKSSASRPTISPAGWPKWASRSVPLGHRTRSSPPSSDGWRSRAARNDLDDFRDEGVTSFAREACRPRVVPAGSDGPGERRPSCTQDSFPIGSASVAARAAPQWVVAPPAATRATASGSIASAAKTIPRSLVLEAEPSVCVDLWFPGLQAPARGCSGGGARADSGRDQDGEAQAAVDHRRALSAFAEAIEGEAFDENKANAGAAFRLQSAERLRGAVRRRSSGSISSSIRSSAYAWRISFGQEPFRFDSGARAPGLQGGPPSARDLSGLAAPLRPEDAHGRGGVQGERLRETDRTVDQLAAGTGTDPRSLRAQSTQNVHS